IDNPLASGRGILLMRSFLDGVQFRQGGRRVILTLNRRPVEEQNSAKPKPVIPLLSPSPPINSHPAADVGPLAIERALSSLFKDHANLPHATAERRHFDRMAYNEQIDVLVAADTVPIHAFARDISHGG